MAIYKKVTCLAFFVALCMLLLQTSVAFADSIENDTTPDSVLTSDVSEMFAYVSSNLETIIPEYQSNNEVYLCAPIHSYVQVQDEFIDGPLYYPMVTEANEVIGFFLATKESGAGESIINFTTEFCEKINQNYSPNKNSCFIIDEEFVYLLQGKDTITLGNNEYDTIAKGAFDRMQLHQNTVEETVFGKNNHIAHSSRVTSASVESVTSNSTLTVRRIKQLENSSYCWACVSVSFGQYFKPNIILDEKQIAIKYKGDLYTSNNITGIGLLLSQEYGIAVGKYLYQPTFATLKSNINRDAPVIVRVEYSNGRGHFILVNGYNDSTSKYIVAMDPISGTYRVLNTTFSGGNYYLSYVSPGGSVAAATHFVESL